MTEGPNVNMQASGSEATWLQKNFDYVFLNYHKAFPVFTSLVMLHRHILHSIVEKLEGWDQSESL